MQPVAVLSTHPNAPFPNPETARHGLVAVGGDFSVRRLLTAYRSGIFPWSFAPITWWSPDPRAIFDLDTLHIPRSLRRSLRRYPFRFTLDTAFEAVIRACAEAPRGPDQTWITPEFVTAYTALHHNGFAHSIECWLDGRLVGGLYGVAVGGFFAGESMFHRVPDASKAALCTLRHHLRQQGFTLFDTQMLTPTTALLGATEIPRRDYLDRLAAALRLTPRFVPNPGHPEPAPLPLPCPGHDGANGP